MKINSQFLAIFLVLSSLLSFGQTDTTNSNLALDKGIALFKQRKYSEAETFLEQSIKLFPQNKAWYYLALTGIQLNDTCKFCESLKKSGNYGGQEDSKLFDSLCYLRHNMNYRVGDKSGLNFFLMESTDRCTLKEYRDICVKDMKYGGFSTFDIEGFDSTAIKDEDLFIKHPRLLDVSSDEITFFYLHDMPTYPGGDEGRINFLMNNVKYPQFAKEAGIQGTVYVTFIVKKNGKVTGARILRGIGGGCDEEVIRIVNLMPKWQPGKLNNKEVNVRFNMPVKFTLN